jgi:N-methylhydantoinase B
MAIETTSASATERPPGFWDGVQRSYIPAAELVIDPSVRLHDEAASDIDPITYEVVRYALMNANIEHAALIQRLCVSPITMLTRDFQTSVLTETGDLVFLGPNLQYFSNAHMLTIKWTLENRSKSPGIAPGDMFLSTDAYVGAPHQPDTAIIAPVFVGDELFCWTANTMHLSDVGGSVQGSFCVTAQDAWGDPPNFPPIKLVDGGELRADVEQLFARQSRLPVSVLMDVRAAVSANEATRQKITGLVERYGADVVKGVMRRTMDAAEQLFVERLQSIPDGTWSHRAYTEAAVPGDRGVYAYQINVTKRGDRLLVDNRGTDPQTGSINIAYVAFSGAVLAALTQQMVSDLAGAYGGVYRRVDFDCEPGLLNCAEFPAAVSPSGAYTTEMNLNAAAMAIGKMLACGDDASRELILGPNVPHFYACIYGGLDAEGRMFILPNTNGMIGSLAGMPERDGVDAGGHYWIPEGIAYNIEDMEQQFPILYLYRRLLEGSHDGAGRHRGGLGFVEATIPWTSPFLQMVVYSNDSFAKAQGELGGNPGTRAWFRVRAGTDVAERMAAGELPQSVDGLAGEEREVYFKGAPIDVVGGDVFEWCSPTTGGFGDPLLRDPQAALQDVEAHNFTAEAVEAVYGVVLRDGAVDAEATAALRRERRAERLGGREPGAPVAPPAGARRAGELLYAVDGRWWVNGTDRGPVGETYKEHCTVREVPARLLAPGYDAADVEMADKIVHREFLCPVTGYRVDTELARVDEPYLRDIALAS